MTDEELVELAAALAMKAGEAILGVRTEGFEVLRKQDASPVTAADHAAEAIIVQGLRAAVPGIPVIAEEEFAAGRMTSPTREYWLVDPLDGTREFAAGRDEFAVNIGLIRDGKAVAGVVGVPALGELFGGIVGQGAWKRTARGETRITARPPSADGLVVLASRHHADDARLAAFLERYHVARVVNFGSSVKFCRLAEGQADLYPRIGRTMEWDTAAPQALLEAAGGAVRTMEGEALNYGKPGWANPSFLCTGRLDRA